VRFRELCGGIDPRAWRELSMPVDVLVGGEAYRFHRYELPDDHPLRRAGCTTCWCSPNTTGWLISGAKCGQ
jgi:hypothetical protein